MKYLVSADRPSVDEQVVKRFGRAAYQLVVDVDRGALGIEECRRSVHDLAAHGLDELREDVSGVITGNIEPQAFADANQKRGCQCTSWAGNRA